MDWLVAVLLSTTLFAVVSILDKRLVEHSYPSFSTFNVTFGLLQFLVAGVFFVAVMPTVGFEGGGGIPWALGAGVLWGVGLSLFFYGLRLEEVSRAAPMQSLSPVFTAIFAGAFFGDSVSAPQWVLILVVVTGAAMVNLRPANGSFRIARGRAFLVLLTSAFTLGWAFIVSDEAVARMNVWAVQGLRALGMGVTVVALTWRPRLTGPLIAAIGNPRASGLMFLTEGIMGPLAALTFVYALSVGPVSLVTTVGAIRPLAILAITIGLSTPLWNVLNEQIDPRTIGLKAVSTVLIVGGVIGLGLT
jgi:drug/metabolite transporter (DMT)-like permease